jgi:hypothetical protein
VSQAYLATLLILAEQVDHREAMGTGAEGFKPLPFALSRVWGADAAKPVAYVLLAEFDIDTGRQVCQRHLNSPAPSDCSSPPVPAARQHADLTR